jgi:phospholipase/carboxylesterase
MNTLPATIDINPKGNKPMASVIWLHGLGADANDFVPLAEQFETMGMHNIRFVFPYAPVRPITVNGGMKMRGWYDIYELNLSAREDLEGIKDSEKLVELLIEREITLNVPSNRIILAGFSQGAAISLYVGARYPKPLGGIIALSGYLLNPAMLAQERNPANASIPIFMASGLFDPIVPFSLGENSRQRLSELGFPVEWHSYPMPHTVVPEEIEDMSVFLKRVSTGKAL